ncbi:MAG: hypothetical protein GY821_02650, partial [Gammaproteobacteria bacterium]|nr:hypothetical protein [Gammaproteobacteria bacterium]
LQITDLKAYTNFVQNGQRGDETAEQFKQRMFSFIKSNEQHETDAEHVRKRREDFRHRMFIVQELPEEKIDANTLKQTLETVSSHIKFIWNAIINVWLDKASKQGALVPEDLCLTPEELAHADNLTERMLVIPPQKYFKPENDAVGRTMWYMELIKTTAQLITVTKAEDAAFRALEKEIGRVKAVEKAFARAAVQSGGVVRSLTPREITALNELEVQNRIRIALNKQKSKGIEPAPEDAARILAHQSTEPVTGTVQKEDDKVVPEVIVSPKGEAASDPNAKGSDSKTSSHHPLEGDGGDSVGKKADSTTEDLGRLSLSQDEGESKGADAHKGESTCVDGINVIPVVDKEPPLPKTRPVGAKGKRAKAAEKKRQRRAQRLAATLQPSGEAGASGS